MQKRVPLCSPSGRDEALHAPRLPAMMEQQLRPIVQLLPAKLPGFYLIPFTWYNSWYFYLIMLIPSKHSRDLPRGHGERTCNVWQSFWQHITYSTFLLLRMSRTVSRTKHDRDTNKHFQPASITFASCCQTLAGRGKKQESPDNDADHLNVHCVRFCTLYSRFHSCPRVQYDSLFHALGKLNWKPNYSWMFLLWGLV